MEILCVDPDRVDLMWPHVQPMLALAYAEGRGDGDTDSLHAGLAARSALLWIAWDGAKVIAAAVTQLLTTRRGKVCAVLAAAGMEMGSEAWRAAMDAIEAYARAEGCAFVRLEGRSGWRRILPDFHQPWIVLEKRL